jgi:hypothetical protein
VTVERLQKISVDIIGCYKRRDVSALSWYAETCELDTDRSNLQRMFSSLIQKYHPDKHSLIMKEISSAYESCDGERLSLLKKSFLFGDAPRMTVRVTDEIVERDESYGYAEDDFGYDERPREEEPSEREYDRETEVSSDATFYEALNREFLGNNDIVIDESDLRNLDGDLDLSDCGIADLSGAEYCVYLSGLNLSCNRIRSIERLSNMVHLRWLFLADNEIELVSALSHLTDIEELDLSGNSIEEVSVLLSLGRLSYCNLMNNPIRDMSVIRRLEERGVIVIF